MAMAKNRKNRKAQNCNYVVAVRAYNILEQGLSIAITDQTGERIIDPKDKDLFRQSGNFERSVASYDPNGELHSATARFLEGFEKIEWDVDMFMEELICSFSNQNDAIELSNKLWKKKIWNTVTKTFVH